MWYVTEHKYSYANVFMTLSPSSIDDRVSTLITINPFLSFQENVLSFMQAECEARGRNDMPSWTIIERDVPQQADAKSCGVFTCANAFLEVGILCSCIWYTQGVDENMAYCSFMLT